MSVIKMADGRLLVREHFRITVNMFYMKITRWTFLTFVQIICLNENTHFLPFKSLYWTKFIYVYIANFTGLSMYFTVWDLRFYVL